MQYELLLWARFESHLQWEVFSSFSGTGSSLYASLHIGNSDGRTSTMMAVLAMRRVARPARSHLHVAN